MTKQTRYRQSLPLAVIGSGSVAHRVDDYRHSPGRTVCGCGVADHQRVGQGSSLPLCTVCANRDYPTEAEFHEYMASRGLHGWPGPTALLQQSPQRPARRRALSLRERVPRRTGGGWVRSRKTPSTQGHLCYLSSMEITFEDAVEIARDAHAGQFDKNGAEYIHHPLAVAQALTPFGEHARIAGVLHDVVEDSRWTLQDLLDAGVPARSVRAVAGATRDKGSAETYQEWIEGMSLRERYSPSDLIKPSVLMSAGLDSLTPVPLVSVLKLADNLHNSLPSRVNFNAQGAALLRRYARARFALEESLPEGVVALVREGFSEVVPDWVGVKSGPNGVEGISGFYASRASRAGSPASTASSSR